MWQPVAPFKPLGPVSAAGRRDVGADQVGVGEPGTDANHPHPLPLNKNHKCFPLKKRKIQMSLQK